MTTDTLISVRGLQVAYGQTEILKGIDLDIHTGEMLALLGASGCGKTTLLRTLAGFTTASGGTVSLRGKNVLSLPPERRGMVMVFQSYALWPHMNVTQNIAYGLRLRGMKTSEISRQVESILDMLDLSGLGRRRISQLSGGQRQRVALGRALAVKPDILLLDEPLSNLDAGIRQQVRHEIRSIQKKLGLTSILVTHDREEALTMADRIVILNAGRVEQVGKPEDVFNHPASPYVAGFMGASNNIVCQFSCKAGRVNFLGENAGGKTLLDVAEEKLPQLCGDGGVQVFFRSETASLHPSGSTPEDTLHLPGRIGQTSFLGGTYRCEVKTAQGCFLVDHRVRPQPEQEVTMCVPTPNLHIFPAAQAEQVH